MNRYGIIYRVTNNINEKIYVGQTTKTELQRFNIHVNEANRKDTKRIVLAEEIKTLKL